MQKIIKRISLLLVVVGIIIAGAMLNGCSKNDITNGSEASSSKTNNKKTEENTKNPKSAELELAQKAKKNSETALADKAIADPNIVGEGQTFWCINGTDVNLRNAPSLNSSVIGSLNRDVALDILGYNGDFAHVKVKHTGFGSTRRITPQSEEGKEGYVHRKYISRVQL